MGSLRVLTLTGICHRFQAIRQITAISKLTIHTKLKGNMANTARTRPVSVPSSGSRAMEHQDHSVLLADNRFLKLSKPRKDIPSDYFAGLDDYLATKFVH
jgi:hypothetical protein